MVWILFNGPAPLKPDVSEFDTVVVTLALTAPEAESEPAGSLPHCASLEWFAVSQCSMKIYLQPVPLLH